MSPGAASSTPFAGLLVVEDSPTQAAALREILEEAGHAVTVQESGEAALSWLGVNRPKLVLSDILMPGLDGFSVCRHIKEKTPDLPVILLTSLNEAEDIVKGLQAGADNFITKPFEPDYLIGRIALILASRHAGRARIQSNIDVVLGERRYQINAERQQILDLLISSFETAVRRNHELTRAREQLRALNESLEQRIGERTAELTRANRVKDEFLAMLSHELRTPLYVIIGFTELVLRGGRLGEEDVQSLNNVMRNASTLTKIIADLLDVSSIVRGSFAIETAPVCLGPLLGDVVASLQPMASAKRITLQHSADDAPAVVIGDERRLRQLVANLLTNALKFTPEGGHVTARLTGDAATVELAVTDDGIGIEAEFLPHVFGRFHQADSYISRRFGGLGLGLSICKDIAEAHGGWVAAASAGSGRGSTFTLHLPRPTPAASAAAAGKGAAGGRRCLDGVRVLIVEDAGDAHLLASKVLVEAGADVSVVTAAPAALARVDQWHPDVLLLDLKLPGDGGPTLLREIRAHEARAGRRPAPAAALTGQASGATRAEMLQAGFSSHLCKPISTDELLDAVAQLVEESGDARLRF